ncbi:unnamed protein product [Urochloa decumbens]|uniref:RING-type domain-containing protein n=1 Tax=Urochloa decumbens TaxID=240449 RepID=A0ABC8XTE1_9POAL
MEIAGAMPNVFEVASQTTGVELIDGPVGGFPSHLLIQFEFVRRHRWIGIGGHGKEKQPPSHDFRAITVQLDYPGINVLQDGELCRTLIRETVMNNIVGLGQSMGMPVCHWDKAIPEDLDARIVELAHDRPLDCAYRCEVNFTLDIEFGYCEAAALLQGCIMAPRECYICHDALTPGSNVMYLPDCTHAYHVDCIKQWFKKSPTCPVCREDYSRLIPDEYRLLGENMRANDGL